MFAQWLSTHARCNRNLSCDGGIVCDLCATLPEKPCDPETQARSAPNRQPHAGLRQCGRKMLSHALSLAQKWSAPPRTADGGAPEQSTLTGTPAQPTDSVSWNLSWLKKTRDDLSRNLRKTRPRLRTRPHAPSRSDPAQRQDHHARC